MLVLLAGEHVLFQKEANLTLRYKSMKGKQDGRGILYITNMRIVFEDHKQGILMQVFPSPPLYELQAYRRVRGLLTEKLALDIEKSNSQLPAVTATAELEFRDRRAVAEAEYALNTLLRSSSNSSNSNSSSNLQYLPEDNSKSNSNRLTASRSPLSNYSMGMSTSSTKEEKEEKRMPEEYRKWISDIKFTWDPDKVTREIFRIHEGKTYEWTFFTNALIDIDSTLEDMKPYFDISRFSPDFRYKVAREVYRLIAITPMVKDLKKYNTNRYWIGIIDNAYRDGSSELVGVVVNSYADSFHILNPIHWQHRFRSWVREWYDIENDEPTFTYYISERDREFTTSLANACKDFYYGILNRDFRKAEEAHRVISETYRKYGSEIEYAGYTGEYGLILKYAMEMHARNIPFPVPTTEKKTPV